MIRSYRFPIAPNSSERLQIFGDYIRVYSSAQTLRVKTSAGDEVELREGDEVECREFEWIEVSQNGLVQIAIDIAVGDKHTSLKTSRVNGLVQVVNGEIVKAKAGQCFIGLGNALAVAGNYGQVQLYNPTTSGVNLILNAVNMAATSACWVALKYYSTPLTTLSGNGLNKMQGAANALAEVRIQTNAAVFGQYLGLYGIDSPLGTQDFKMSEPIVIPPGGGVMTEAQTVSVQLLSTFQWSEEKL